jgi:hypothetical protein
MGQAGNNKDEVWSLVGRDRGRERVGRRMGSDAEMMWTTHTQRIALEQVRGG